MLAQIMVCQLVPPVLQRRDFKKKGEKEEIKEGRRKGWREKERKERKKMRKERREDRNPLSVFNYCI